MEAQERILSSRELPLGQQPTLISERQAGHLIRQFQLQLLAALSQGRAELKEMPLNQAGGCSNGHSGPLARTDGSLAQGAEFSVFKSLMHLQC